MVLLNKFSSTSFEQLPNLTGRLLYDTSLNLLRFNNSVNYNNILVFKNLNNNLENINDLTVNGNLLITNHDRTQNMGLTLDGVLVTATAEELNYTQVVPGTAALSKALVLDENSDIEGINILSANTLNVTTLSSSSYNTTGNVGINTIDLAYGLQVNEATGNCLRLIYNTATEDPTNVCDFKLSSTGSLSIEPAGSNPSVSIAANTNTVSLSLTKQNAANNTVDFPLSITVLPDTLAANGLGVGMEFNALNDNYDIIGLGTFEIFTSDVTNNHETAKYRWRLSNDSVFNTVAELDNLGNFTCETITVTNLDERSDIRLKKNITDINIDNSYNNIIKLLPKEYIFKNDIDNKQHSGLIAQEVKEIFPNVVGTINTDELKDLHVIKYTALIPHLINCIKKLDNELLLINNKLKSYSLL